jgi:hypothetical protein
MVSSDHRGNKSRQVIGKILPAYEYRPNIKGFFLPTKLSVTVAWNQLPFDDTGTP